MTFNLTLGKYVDFWQSEKETGHSDKRKEYNTFYRFLSFLFVAHKNSGSIQIVISNFIKLCAPKLFKTFWPDTEISYK